MAPLNRFVFLVLAALLSACASTQSLRSLEEIQKTKGLFTSSLYYVGSSRAHHYFDQFTFFGDAWWVPFYDDDGYTSYKIPRQELSIPDKWEFPRSSYRGEDDERRLKVRIRSSPSPKIEKRKQRTVDEMLERIPASGIIELR